MRRAHSHADEMTMRRRSQTEQVEDLPMFAAPSVAVETSEEAAESVRGSIRTAHAIVVALLIARGNATCDEIRGQAGWSGDYARPRLREMEDMLLVEKCDGREHRPSIMRPTRTGRRAIAYRLTERGKNVR